MSTTGTIRMGSVDTSFKSDFYWTIVKWSSPHAEQRTRSEMLQNGGYWQSPPSIQKPASVKQKLWKIRSLHPLSIPAQCVQIGSTTLRTLEFVDDWNFILVSGFGPKLWELFVVCHSYMYYNAKREWIPGKLTRNEGGVLFVICFSLPDGISKVLGL